MDQLVLSHLALRNLLKRAHDGEEPEALLDLCVRNASAVRITAMKPPAERDGFDLLHAAGEVRPLHPVDADGCCPCRRPWCTGGCQSDGRLTR